MTPRPWTYPEVAELKRLVALRRKDAAIARRLGRSRRSVQFKREQLGLRVLRRWRAIDSLVRRLARDGWHDAEIAGRIGCSRERVRDVRHRLGLRAGRFVPRRADRADLDALPACWACGEPAPKQSGNGAAGWVSRPVRLTNAGMTHVETYCPACFAEYGWGDGLVGGAA